MAELGKLYGVGIGPGDPQLITIKAKQVLERVEVVFVPKAGKKRESLAGAIVSQIIGNQDKLVELVFPMTRQRQVLEGFWTRAADQISARIMQGQQVAFVTLGDPLMYSTYIYLLQLMQRRYPGLEVETIPGITSYSAAAAYANFPLVEGGQRLAILPVAQYLDSLKQIIPTFETVVLMKIGHRLLEVINILDELGLIQQAVFISRVGSREGYVETDLRKLTSSNQGYLSVIIVKNPASKSINCCKKKNNKSITCKLTFTTKLVIIYITPL
jgi:precorrin-2/cobalt-factor-2 C20-methyltransferase